MVFNSFNFLAFFVVVLILYYSLPKSFKIILLLAASMFFYMYHKPVNILIPFSIITVSYTGGILLERFTNRKKLIFLSVLFFNIGMLVVFKYFNFINLNITGFLNMLSLKNPISLSVILPLGISFVTFQGIDYILEVYGNQKAERNFLAFATYIMFFPKILAGPLERSHQFIEQIKKNISFSYEDFVIGLRFVLWGLFKKIVIADRLAPFVNQVFGNVYEYSGITLIVTIIFYLFQLYCDFSGYTEIAIGISRMLGFNLTPNFDRPFIAQSLTGLWKRWHISLSSWINDYLYTPIALQTRYWGKMGLITALVVSFLIIGAWHGGTWNYLIFGVLLSIGVVYEFLTLNFKKKLFKKLPDKFTFYFNVITVFIYFTFTLIFFRADSFKDALYFVKHLFAFNTPLLNPLFFDKKLLPEIIFSFLSIIFLLSFEYNFKGDYVCDRLTKGKKYYRWAVYLILANLILFFGVFGSDKFIYFQF